MPFQSATDLVDRQEVFQSVQKAYAYLTNPLTKVIYDEYGVLGLAIYEKNKSVFAELQEEIRGIKIPTIDQNVLSQLTTRQSDPQSQQGFE